jgi:hypothetical protein
LAGPPPFSDPWKQPNFALNDHQVCDLDNGYPERLKHTSNSSSTVYTGFSKFQAKRTGKQLMIYTATGKREYWIQDSW